MKLKNGDESESDRRLDEVVTAYLKDIEMGRGPNQQEWLARYPDLAADLAVFFAAQDQVAHLAAPCGCHRHPALAMWWPQRVSVLTQPLKLWHQHPAKRFPHILP